jgi:hypothetical protein
MIRNNPSVSKPRAICESLCPVSMQTYLRTIDDGLETRSTEPIDSQGRDGDGNATT